MLNYLKVLGFMAMMIAILFGSAGRFDLPFVWATVGIYVAFMCIRSIVRVPDEFSERAQRHFVHPQVECSRDADGVARRFAVGTGLIPFVHSLLLHLFEQKAAFFRR